MILARVVGTVIATRKDPRLEGSKLLILKPVAPDGTPESGYVISVDTVGAGSSELVIAPRELASLRWKTMRASATLVRLLPVTFGRNSLM